MIWYFLIGIGWTAWLEYYTTKYNVLETLEAKWTMLERIYQTVLWPISLIVFIVTFFKGLNDGE